MHIAGIDEAGRGPLAGPIVAAAVIFPQRLKIKGLKDSKKLSSKKREELFTLIQKEALATGIGIISEKEIDRINILEATKLAMLTAIKDLKVPPDFLLIDGRDSLKTGIRQKSVIRGDDRIAIISAASIIAKVTRDRLMAELHLKYPRYNFNGHKGYGTKEHLELIRRHGPCEIHRKTFKGVREFSDLGRKEYL